MWRIPVHYHCTESRRKYFRCLNIYCENEIIGQINKSYICVFGGREKETEWIIFTKDCIFYVLLHVNGITLPLQNIKVTPCEYLSRRTCLMLDRNLSGNMYVSSDFLHFRLDCNPIHLFRLSRVLCSLNHLTHYNSAQYSRRCIKSFELW